MVASKAQVQTEKRWQQRKSEMTRDSILRAAVACLVETGYTGLTTIEVTKRAGISRGALHHHFANRTELVSALIDHVLHRRLEFFLGEYISVLKTAEPAEAIKVGAQVHWESVNTPEYAAFIELTMAARTDAELADLLRPATQAFDREWEEAMESAFPQWKGLEDARRLASDLAAAAHLGLLINRSLMTDSDRASAVRAEVVKAVEAVYASHVSRS